MRISAGSAAALVLALATLASADMQPQALHRPRHSSLRARRHHVEARDQAASPQEAIAQSPTPTSIAFPAVEAVNGPSHHEKRLLGQLGSLVKSADKQAATGLGSVLSKIQSAASTANAAPTLKASAFNIPMVVQ